jgi:hypothetical protein
MAWHEYDDWVEPNLPKDRGKENGSVYTVRLRVSQGHIVGFDLRPEHVRPGIFKHPFEFCWLSDAINLHREAKTIPGSGIH